MRESKVSLKNQPYKYDKEWVDLIAKAKELGLTPAEVRYFLNRGGFNKETDERFIV